MPHDTPMLPGLSPVDALDIHARFDGGALSSDGGALLLREIERRMGIADVLASSLRDRRDPGRIVHSYASMIRARVMVIARGSEGCDDPDALRHDPALKMACERAPEDRARRPGRAGLAAPPVAAGEHRRLAGAGADGAADDRPLLRQLSQAAGADRARHRRYHRPHPTIDRTHGGQQLPLFNTPADGHCFQPIHIFEAATGRPVAFLLRPGKRPSGAEAARVLHHVIRRIRANWPRVAIAVRADGHYGTADVMEALDRMSCRYTLGLPGNARLKEIAHPWCEDAATHRVLTGKDTGKDRVHRFFETSCAAKGRAHERRLIARLGATAMGADARFVVTNMGGRATHPYEKLSCARGAMENLIKEHKHYTKPERPSCPRWQANQVRLFRHTAASRPLHRRRGAAPKRSRRRTATVETIRASFLKIAVRVEQLKTRIRLSLPCACPHAPMIALMLRRIHAQGP